ncbi:MAG: methylmalonyl-CoA epimerase [Dehalococcoidia bacterium]|nr:methylmalonyl-CoA epimerase [Dehalococcoidia bacterium]
MIKKLHHIAVVVTNLDDALAMYDKLFGLKPTKVATVPAQGVKAALLPIGQTEIELLEPIDPNSGVAKFLAKQGEGMHHICLETDDVAADLNTLGDKGVALIDKTPRMGLAGKVGFMHPKSTKGVLIELATPVNEH